MREPPVLQPMTTIHMASPEPTEVGEAESSRARLFQLLGQLYKYKWLIVAVAASVCVATYFWTMQQPRIYEADCRLEYVGSQSQPLNRDIDALSGSHDYWSAQEDYATQNQVIASRAVAAKVVQKLGLHRNPDFMGVDPKLRDTWKGGDPIVAAGVLQSQLRVIPERETRLVHLLVRDRSPERAMVLANAVADAYIEKTVEDRLGSTTSAVEWLGAQLGTLKQDLERSELALHDFVESEANLAMPFEQQQSMVASQIQRFGQQRDEARIQRSNLEAKLAAIEKVDPSDPASLNAYVTKLSPTLGGVRGAYLERDRERAALALRYGDNHPEIKKLDTELKRLQKQIKAEVDALANGTRAELEVARQIEKDMRAAQAQTNAQGLELSLQEITHRRLQRERDNASRLYGTILERSAETDLARVVDVQLARVVDRALKPTFSVEPKLRNNLVVGGVLGLLLGIGIAFLLSILDRTLRSAEDVEALGITVLGILPRIDRDATPKGVRYGSRHRRRAAEPVDNPDLVVHTHPKSTVAECCRTVRTNITFMSADRPQRALVVTSPSPREGKTTVTISLAVSLAQNGKRVLIADTDLRRPRIHKAFGLAQGRGVTTVLVGEHAVAEAVQHTQVPGVDVLTSGPIPPNPSELLHTQQFGELVRDLTSRYDCVLFDSPPLQAVTDAAVIAPQVDGTVVVVHGQRTTRDALRGALRQLRDVGAALTGSVVNNVDLAQRRYGYQYGTSYYYRRSDYYGTEGEQGRDAPAAEA